MKYLLFVVVILLTVSTAKAQDNEPVTLPEMTRVFADSLKAGINKIIAANYDIDLWYQSDVAPDGKLVKPLITRQVNHNDINYNPFVQQMRSLIMGAPSWVRPNDNSMGKASF